MAYNEYASDDGTWYSVARRLQAKIDRIWAAVLAGTPCDKWGEPVAVGDRVKYSSLTSKKPKEAVISSIQGEIFILDGSNIHWSYVEKLCEHK